MIMGSHEWRDGQPRPVLTLLIQMVVWLHFPPPPFLPQRSTGHTTINPHRGERPGAWARAPVLPAGGRLGGLPHGDRELHEADAAPAALWETDGGTMEFIYGRDLTQFKGEYKRRLIFVQGTMKRMKANTRKLFLAAHVDTCMFIDSTGVNHPHDSTT